jgi:uncharacterized membrane protein required for colicin V production
MIPVEILWLTLIGIFGIIGMARGLWKEIGTSTILLLSLFTLHLVETLIVDTLSGVLTTRVSAGLPEGTTEAIYYSVTIVFVAFISYQGIVLEFPVKKQGGLLKWIFGLLGGLVNGYLIVGTIWNAVANAGYFGIANIQDSLTALHQSIVPYLPISLMNASDFIPYIFLVVGMVLLLAIVLK